MKLYSDEEIQKLKNMNISIETYENQINYMKKVIGKLKSDLQENNRINVIGEIREKEEILHKREKFISINAIAKSMGLPYSQVYNFVTNYVEYVEKRDFKFDKTENIVNKERYENYKKGLTISEMAEKENVSKQRISSWHAIYNLKPNSGKYITKDDIKVLNNRIKYSSEFIEKVTTVLQLTDSCKTYKEVSAITGYSESHCGGIVHSRKSYEISVEKHKQIIKELEELKELCIEGKCIVEISEELDINIRRLEYLLYNDIENYDTKLAKQNNKINVYNDTRREYIAAGKSKRIS